MIVKRQYEDRYHILKAKMPCLITALSELNEPRYMTPGGIFDAYREKEVKVWTRPDLKVDDGNIGLKGSPTRVFKSFTKAVKGKGTRRDPRPAGVGQLAGRQAQRKIHSVRKVVNEMAVSDYKGVFIFAQQVDNKITGVSYELIGKGKQLAADLGDEVTAVLLGHQVTDLAKKLARYGADRVIVVDDPAA